MNIKFYWQILFYIIVITNLKLNSQNLFLPSRPYQPWFVTNDKILGKTTIINSSLVSDTTDGYNCFRTFPNNLYLQNNNTLYLLLTMYIKNDAEGYAIIKYDLDNYKIAWQKSFTLADWELRELPVALHLNKEENKIEILSLQKRKPFDPILKLPFIFFDKECGLVKRQFDSNSGDLISKYESHEKEIFTHGLIPSGNAYSYFAFLNDEIFYYNNEFNNQNRKSYFRKIDNKSFQTITIDSIEQNFPPYELNKLIADNYDFRNGVYATHYDFVSELKLTKFNLKGNALREITLDSIIYPSLFDSSFGISEVDNSYIYTTGYKQIDPFDNLDYFYFIYDHEFNLIKFIDSSVFNKGESPGYIKKSLDEQFYYLVSFKKNTNTDNKDNYTNLYKLDNNSSELELLVSLPFNDSLQYSVPLKFFETDKTLTILYNETSLYLDETNDIFTQDANASALSLITFDKDLLLNNNEFSSFTPWKCFPNPVVDILNIEPNNLDNYQYKIFNVHGKHIQTDESIHNSQLSISNLLPGIYLIKIYNNDKIQVTLKFIKQ